MMNRLGIWRWTQIVLTAGIIASAGVLVWQLAAPLRIDDSPAGVAAGRLAAAADLSRIGQNEPGAFRKIAGVIRPGLFKSESPLSDKPLADKTIETIRSQLQLQCIMDQNGEPVAYVRIKGEGMKRFKIGESCDLFTVLGIGEKSIEISIVGHRTVLSF